MELPRSKRSRSERATDTEGGYCGGEKYPVAAGAFCKWTFCPAPDDGAGRRLDDGAEALPLLTAASRRRWRLSPLADPSNTLTTHDMDYFRAAIAGVL